MAEFGTMEDFDKLLKEIHARDMKLVIDLVVNHTSDEHKWFKEALKSKDNPYHDYYIWRDATDAGITPPNNWVSLFKGSAWNYYENLNQWALHLFTKKQMDLNWENEKVRQSVYEMMLWWLDKGVDGFRMDVINFISKTKGLPEANAFMGMLTGYKGAEYYFYGPRLHEFLHEMREKTFGNYDVYTVGECGGAGIEMDKMLTADFRGELDTVFNFDFLINQGHTAYDPYEQDMYKVMENFETFQTEYTNHCWPTVFFENHDNPRVVSRTDRSGAYRDEIAKVCALIEMTLRGTPYIYQGQELAMANVEFDSIEEMNDVQSINFYKDAIRKGKDREKYFKLASIGSRDNARTPFQWSDSKTQVLQQASRGSKSTTTTEFTTQRTKQAVMTACSVSSRKQSSSAKTQRHLFTVISPLQQQTKHLFTAISENTRAKSITSNSISAKLRNQDRQAFTITT